MRPTILKRFSQNKERNTDTDGGERGKTFTGGESL